MRSTRAARAGSPATTRATSSVRAFGSRASERARAATFGNGGRLHFCAMPRNSARNCDLTGSLAPWAPGATISSFLIPAPPPAENVPSGPGQSPANADWRGRSGGSAPTERRPEAPDRRVLVVEEIVEGHEPEAVAGDLLDLGPGERPGHR